MKTSSLISGMLLFAAGCATGWVLANLTRSAARVAPVVTAPAFEPATLTPTAEQSANTVWLTVEFDGGSSLVPAARLRDSNVLLASLYAVYPANAIYYQTSDGEQHFPAVIAASDAHQLIALTDPQADATGPGYLVSTEDGTLFVGKSVSLELPNQTLKGTIDSALRTAASGRPYFDIGFDRAESLKGGPLLGQGSDQPLGQGSDQLIGFVTSARNPKQGWMHQSGEPFSAMDASSIREFLRAPRFRTAKSARDFSAFFATTPGGLRSTIARLAARQQWASVLDALEALAAQGVDNPNLTQQALTLAAYYHGHQLVEADNSSQAVNLMQNMRQRFGPQQPWCLVEGRAYAQLGRWGQAFAGALECLRDPMGTGPREQDTLASPFREALRPLETRRALIDFAHAMAIQFATDESASVQRRQTVLIDALELGEHAGVYRQLGDLEYEARNYTVAQNYYRNAIRLDPSLEASLGSRLRNSSQRADRAPASEVPFEPRGGGLVVNARLNDSPQNFRLLVDTGATYSALSGGTLLRLGLDDVFNRSADVVELEAAGGTLYARRFTLASMQIGNARVTQMPVVILENMEGFDGLVGLSFLRHFDVSIDQDAGTLILVPQ